MGIFKSRDDKNRNAFVGDYFNIRRHGEGLKKEKYRHATHRAPAPRGAGHPYPHLMSVVRVLAAGVGAAALVLLSSSAAIAASAVDQQSSGTPNASTSSTATSQTGQTFTPGVTGLLTRIDVSDVSQGSSYSGSLTLAVYATTAGLPTGSAIASEAIPQSSVPTPGSGPVSFTFASPPSLIAGQRYAFALIPQGGTLSYQVVQPGTYAGGEAIQNGPAAWVTYGSPHPDLVFTTYMNTAQRTDDSAPIPIPIPILQQFGKPMSGTCDAAAPAGLNWSNVSSGRWGESWAQWMNGGRGGAVCTRTLVFNMSTEKWMLG